MQKRSHTTQVLNKMLFFYFFSQSVVQFSTSLMTRHDGDIKKSGGKIAERGDVLEKDYFRKKVTYREQIHITRA